MRNLFLLLAALGLVGIALGERAGPSSARVVLAVGAATSVGGVLAGAGRRGSVGLALCCLGIALLGSALGLAGAGIALAGTSARITFASPLPGFPSALGSDPLTGFFALPIFLVGGAGAVPYGDYVPAGTLELVRAAGANPVSSAELVSRYCSVWSADDLAGHLRAAGILSEIAQASIRRIGERAREGDPVDEQRRPLRRRWDACARYRG